MRRGNPDANQAAIVVALRKLGCRVTVLSSVGNGVPDLLVCLRDKLFLVELKNMEGRGRRFTEAQKVFHSQWPVIVADTVEEAWLEIVRRAA